MVMSDNLRTFYTLILTQTLSLVGSRISGLAIGIWLFGETGSATPLALVAFFATIPTVLASTVSGVLADRWDRRHVMILADTGQALGTLLLLLSVLSGDFQLWHLYTVTFIQAIFGVFQGPAFQASVTMLVPDSQRDRANAIQQMANPAAGAVAPVIAGGVYAAVGLYGAILIDLATFIVAVGVIFALRIPRPAQTAEGLAMRGSIWKEALGGLVYLWQRRTLFWMMIYISVVNFLISGVMVLSTPYILGRTGSSEALLGLALGLMNLGMLAGAVVMSMWGGTRPRIHTMMPGIIITGVLLALAAMAQSTLALMITFTLLLMPLPFVNAAAMSIIQAKVAPDLQGRVFAVLGQISMLLIPLSYLIAGPLADHIFEPAVGQPGWSAAAPLVGAGAGAGIGLLMLGAGGAIALISALVYSLPAIRSLEANLPDYDPDTPTSDQEPMPETTPAPTSMSLS
jgi:DHA3 family macrolide efflux protein-like MFS transporter